MTTDRVLPNVIIAGAPKCGTTSLFQYLGAHPQVCPSSEKETRYLIDPGYPLYRDKYNISTHGLEGYRSFFESYDPSCHQVLLEATPDYLYQATPLEILPEFPTAPTVIFLLRKPSARVYSLFRFAQNNIGKLDKRMGFAEFLDKVYRQEFPKEMKIVRNAITHSQYADYLEGWYRRLGADSVHAFLFEDMVADPCAFMQGLSRLLSIDPDFYAGYTFQSRNKTEAIRSQRLHRLRHRYGDVAAIPGVRPVARAAYRLFNVGRQKPVPAPDRSVLQTLDVEFEAANRRLAALSGLDLSRWSTL